VLLESTHDCNVRVAPLVTKMPPPRAESGLLVSKVNAVLFKMLQLVNASGESV
jgi:hypothetical protein